MKKLLFGLSVCFATLLSAQNYPNNGWGNGNNNDYSYNNNDDDYYFPDDYYYDYPSDYYADDYYQGFYNDYRQSLDMINWNRFFRQNRLNRQQIALIIDLNNQFSSYNVWNSYYRSNPQRWYYDRYYALERILGPSVYVIFQNNYYNGYAPVAYYNHRCESYYRPRYYVRPAYVNININHYKINRHQYAQSVGNNYGWNQPRNVSNSFIEDGKRNGNYKSDNSANNGFKTSGSRSNSTESGVRNSSSSTTNGHLSQTISQPRTRSVSADTNPRSTQQTPRTRTISPESMPRSVQQTPRTRSAEPTRTRDFSNNTNSVRAERSTPTRSSTSQRSSSNSQRSSSSGTRGGGGR